MRGRYSASQVKRYLDCPRQWWLKYVKGIPTPDTVDTSWGKRIHKRLEHYRKTGDLGPTDTDFKIVLPALQYVAPPSPDARVEEQFEFQIAPNLGTMIGYIDSVWEDDGAIVCDDYKTTTDFRWAMSEDDLYEDAQSIIYAMSRLIERPEVDRVRNRWIYMLRSKTKHGALLREVEYTRESLGPLWDQISEHIERMDALYAEHNQDSVEYNVGACGKYRGCPYAGSTCGINGQQAMRGFFVNLKERMARQKAAKREAPTTAADTPQTQEPPTAPPRHKVNPPEGDQVQQPLSLQQRAEAQKAEAQKVEAPKVKGPCCIDPPGSLGNPEGTYTLYLDCQPSRADYTHLADLVQVVNKRVRTEYNVSHYRLIPDLYGGAPGALQELLVDVLADFPPRHLVVDTALPEARDCLSFLLQFAHEVVRRN